MNATVRSFPCLFLTLTLGVIVAPPADACGVSLPGSLPQACSRYQPQGPVWKLEAGLGSFDTILDFGEEDNTDVEMTSLALSASRPLGGDWTGRITGGIILDGTLSPDAGEAWTVESGLLLGLGGDFPIRPLQGSRPALDLSVDLSASWATLMQDFSGRKDKYRALDLRLGMRSTWQVTSTLYPYAVGRLFGGPVNWETEGGDRQGSDTHHYQLGGGLASRLGPVGVFVEYVPLGEEALSAGLSWPF